MTPELKAVVLDYATELQTNDEPWREFEYQEIDNHWHPCRQYNNPCSLSRDKNFRRKPKTITVTMPLPESCNQSGRFLKELGIQMANEADRDKALEETFDLISAMQEQNAAMEGNIDTLKHGINNRDELIAELEAMLKNRRDTLSLERQVNRKRIDDLEKQLTIEKIYNAGSHKIDADKD